MSWGLGLLFQQALQVKGTLFFMIPRGRATTSTSPGKTFHSCKIKRSPPHLHPVCREYTDGLLRLAAINNVEASF